MTKKETYLNMSPFRFYFIHKYIRYHMKENNVIQTGMIMDNVSNTPTDFDKNQEQVQAAIDNKKMMEAMARYKAAHTPKIKEHKIGRNDKCPCGSGKKYKNCCLSSGKYENYILKK